MIIAVAGASGFVGQKLIDRLEKHPEVKKLFALARRPKSDPSNNDKNKVIWKKCDLFSVLQLEQALEGADVGIYLVHSMLPTAKLDQTRFEDSDLLLADHFARTAKKMGLKRIIYLGGLVPKGKLSRHLESRLETEQVLASTGIPLTTLRAGLVIGTHGSSFQMLYLLVKRLPVMICPSWTQSKTQCIYEEDVISMIEFCVFDANTIGRTFDIGNDEIVTYRKLMEKTANAMKVKRLFVSVPLFSPGLSRLWVALITGGSTKLIGPLVQSLKHSMLIDDSRRLTGYKKAITQLDQALSLSTQSIRPSLRSSTRQQMAALKADQQVRSIQRFVLPSGQSAESISEEYFRWLPEFLSPFIRVRPAIESKNQVWEFSIVGIKKPLLVLKRSDQTQGQDRIVFYIVSGLLVSKKQSQHARLEFIEVLNRKFVIAAIHEFVPALPWRIYRLTQAILHFWVMKSFGRHLNRLG